MRSTKIVSALVAIVMTAGLMLVASSLPASSVAAPGVAAKGKVKHDLKAYGEEIGGNSNKFRTFGKVSTYKNRKIIIQRKVNKAGYKFWKKTKTNKKGKFSERIYGGKRGSVICYKVVVPSTKKYKTTKKAIGCIRTY